MQASHIQPPPGRCATPPGRRRRRRRAVPPSARCAPAAPDPARVDPSRRHAAWTIGDRGGSSRCLARNWDGATVLLNIGEVKIRRVFASAEIKVCRTLCLGQWASMHASLQ